MRGGGLVHQCEGHVKKMLRDLDDRGPEVVRAIGPSYDPQVQLEIGPSLRNMDNAVPTVFGLMTSRLRLLEDVEILQPEVAINVTSISYYSLRV